MVRLKNIFILNLNNPIEHIITTGIELPGSDQKKGDRAKNLFDRQKGKKDKDGKMKKVQ